MVLKSVNKLKGQLKVPADKSISHRSVMFGSLAEGHTEISDCLLSADCMSTISCFKKLGIEINVDKEKGHVDVYGKGLHGLTSPSGILDTGNSGTTTRLISGILSGQSFSSTLSGDESLNTRPMKRIITPLSMMGADIKSKNGNDCAPLIINPSKLKGIAYTSPLSSAQVKSAIILAGLYADGETSVTEPYLSRNHTELMLKGFGAEITSENKTATIKPEPKLVGQNITVPGDISSAAYFIAAGLIIPGSEILIKNVGINETRAGILRVCENMGAEIVYLDPKNISGEPVCDLFIKSQPLKGSVIEGEIIPALIDEIPIIAVMAAFAEGQTIIKDAADLKAKESDRIYTTVTNLKKMGADITATDDGMIINGTGALKGAALDSFADHRIAMSMAVAALAAEGTTDIENADCVNISYPNFYKDLLSLTK
ncbi:MAG: 3-phosphoshikimate 1-carboxyvinyltransferase [Eubacterium sp.]|nr:3-phosphoshikimate 1-carboxyvinyltransferase [Eubacterium sp.]